MSKIKSFTPLEKVLSVRERSSLTGFTLVELIVVIAIVAILSAVIAPNAFKAVEKAKISAATADFKAYKTAAYAFYSDTGTWPIIRSASGSWVLITDNGFLTNRNNWAGWDGPYIESRKTRHPWGGIYGMDCANRGQGTECDIGLFLSDYCYPSGPHSSNCHIPQASMTKIDVTADDGNPAAGDIRIYGGYATTYYHELYGLIVWDAGAVTSE